MPVRIYYFKKTSPAISHQGLLHGSRSLAMRKISTVFFFEFFRGIEVYQIFANTPFLKFLHLLVMFVRRAHPACQMQLGCAVWASKTCGKRRCTQESHQSWQCNTEIQRKSLLLCFFMIVFNKIPTQPNLPSNENMRLVSCEP